MSRVKWCGRGLLALLVSATSLAPPAFAERVREISSQWVLNRSNIQSSCVMLSVVDFTTQMRIDDQARSLFYQLVYEPLSQGCPPDFVEENKNVVLRRFSRFTLQDEATITVYFDDGPCTIRYDNNRSIDSWRSEKVEPEGSPLANCFP